MKLLTLLFILLALCTAFIACNDDDPIIPQNSTTIEQLPPITTVGAGTFGCRVNGKVWVAKSNKTGWPPVFAYFDRSNNNIGITGDIVTEPIHYLIGIKIIYNPDSVNYSIGYQNIDSLSSASYINVSDNLFWKTDSLRGGGVTLLHYDTLTQIISGTFYFDCINIVTGEILKVTDGRFDMHYTY